MNTSKFIIAGVTTALLWSVADEKKYYDCECGSNSSGSCVGLNIKKLLPKEGRDTNTLLMAEVDTQGCLTPQPSPLKGF